MSKLIGLALVIAWAEGFGYLAGVDVVETDCPITRSYCEADADLPDNCNCGDCGFEACGDCDCDHYGDDSCCDPTYDEEEEEEEECDHYGGESETCDADGGDLCGDTFLTIPCIDAIDVDSAIADGGWTYEGDTSIASAAGDVCNANGEGSPDAYYRLSLGSSTGDLCPDTGYMLVSTCDSSYDTFVRVYDLDGNERYECDDCGAYSCPNYSDGDDDDGAAGDGSCCWTVATFDLEAGDFVLLIEGYSCDRGAYTFTVACADTVYMDDRRRLSSKRLNGKKFTPEILEK